MTGMYVTGGSPSDNIPQVSAAHGPPGTARDAALMFSGLLIAPFPLDQRGEQLESDLHGFERIGSLKHVPEYVCLQQERVPGRSSHGA